jgi:hypothetical protein
MNSVTFARYAIKISFGSLDTVMNRNVRSLLIKGRKMLLEKWRDFSALNTWSMEALKSTFQVHYFLEYLASEGK